MVSSYTNPVVTYPLEFESKEEKLIEEYIRYSLNNNGFDVFYQPIIDLNSNLVSYSEALIRFSKEVPSLGFVGPDKFIPVAERRGLIDKIGEFVLRRACEDTFGLQKHLEGNEHSFDNLGVSVNVSPKQLEFPEFSDMVKRVLNETEYDPKYLKLEITESDVLPDIVQTTRIMDELQIKGVQFFMDDIGTKYSGLYYLTKLPYNCLKIDKSFTDKIEDMESKEHIFVRGFIQMGHDMGMKVVAEGVENVDQLEILKLMKCDGIQGYYIGKPMKFLDYAKFLWERAIERKEKMDNEELNIMSGSEKLRVVA